MRRIKINLPGAITNLGVGVNSIGLGIGMYTTVEISERTDTLLNVETHGEDAGRYSLGLRHPVVLGMSRLFQKLEKTVPGLNILVENRIPAALGLGVETAFVVAGLVAANNLFGNPYSRNDVLNLATRLTGRADQAVTTMIGGLTTSAIIDDKLIYRSLPVAAQKLVITLPQLPDYVERTRRILPDRVPMRDALHNLSRLPLLLEAFRSGDMAFAGQVIEDKLFAPYRLAHIPNIEDIAHVAKLNGAAAITLCGSGPALLTFAKDNHAKIAAVMVSGFEDVGIKAQSWVLPIDTQGLIVSVAQSS